MKVKTSAPFAGFKTEVRKDADYAWSIHCNLAMPIKDSLKCSHESANRAAANVMQNLFGVDMTKHSHWESFERQWALEKVEEDKTEAECVAELN